MTGLALITFSGMKHNLRSTTVTVISIIITLMCAVGVAVTLSLAFIRPLMESPSPDRGQLEIALSLLMAVNCLIGLGVNLNSFAFQIITREKSRGVIQSLLATPLGEKSIWAGKSLAIYLPGLIVGMLFALISLFAINYIYFVPSTGFLMNPWIGISSFLAVPLMYLSLCLLVHMVGLTAKPATANVIAQVFLPLIITLFINLAVRSILDTASWVFTVINLGLSAVIGVIVILLLPRLTRERIILSE
ncbi:MAG: hypothetical protein JXA46_04925 [Dehalococcoidales bacterium]|nr:hypothetical protein [Dehalococcoidales bacterium]